MLPRELSVCKEAAQRGRQVLPKAAALASGWAGYEQRAGLANLRKWWLEACTGKQNSLGKNTAGERWEKGDLLEKGRSKAHKRSFQKVRKGERI